MTALGFYTEVHEAGATLVRAHKVVADDRCSCGPRCGSPGKHPASKGWLDDPGKSPSVVVSKWLSNGENISVVPHGQLFVIDIDPEGLPRLDELDLPPTKTVRTPRGGLHYYYRAPEGTAPPPNSAGTTVLGPGVDIRAEGGQAIGPGSNGVQGSYVVEDDRSITEAPAALVERCRPLGMKAGPYSPPVSRDVDVTADTRSLVNSLLWELEAAPEGSRHSVALDVSWWLKSLAGHNRIGEETAYELLRTAWRSSGQTDDDELGRMWEGAAQKQRATTKLIDGKTREASIGFVLGLLEREGYRWLWDLYGWHRWQDETWVPLAETDVTSHVRDLFAANRGQNVSSSKVDEVVKQGRQGALVPRLTWGRGVRDGSPFWLEGPDAGKVVGGVLFRDARVEVLPDGRVSTHPLTRAVFAPSGPLGYAWGNGSVAETPLWDDFCERQFGADPEALLRYVGSALVGDASHHQFLAFVGDAGGGKSVMLNVLQGLLSPHLAFDPRDKYCIAGVERARLVVADDVSFHDFSGHQRPLGWDLWKAMSGESTVRVSIKYAPHYEARFTGLLALASNHDPMFHALADPDQSAWRRRAITSRVRRLEHGQAVDSYHEVLLEKEGEALTRRAIHAYAEGVVKRGGWAAVKGTGIKPTSTASPRHRRERATRRSAGRGEEAT